MTIKDVAKIAGVSVATVSRAINNADSVTDETKKKVMEAIEKTGYQQNMLGRNLRCNKTNIILVMLTTIVNSYCAKLVNSIENEAKNHGYSVMICATNNDPETENRYINFVKNKFVDGIIILNSVMEKSEIIKLSSSFPVVQCSEYIDKQRTPYVTIDNKKAAYDAVSMLIKMGRKKILHIGVNNNLISTKERFEGYKLALLENGIPFDKSLVIYGNYGYRNAHQITYDYFKDSLKADAVFAISDKMAAGTITSLKELGYKVPEDVCVIGFDNTDVTYIYNPTITTVAQPHKEMGKAAFNMLLKRINGEKCKNLVLNHELKLRKSTDIKKEC